jgi:hypothetical protein
VRIEHHRPRSRPLLRKANRERAAHRQADELALERPIDNSHDHPPRAPTLGLDADGASRQRLSANERLRRSSAAPRSWGLSGHTEAIRNLARSSRRGDRSRKPDRAGAYAAPTSAARCRKRPGVGRGSLEETRPLDRAGQPLQSPKLAERRSANRSANRNARDPRVVAALLLLPIGAWRAFELLDGQQ